eukprot:gene7871-10077_t
MYKRALIITSKKYKEYLWKTGAERHQRWREIEAVSRVGHVLETLVKPNVTAGRTIEWSPEARRTVAVMPFLGGAMGAGHSE